MGDPTTAALIGLGAQGIGMIGEGARYRRNMAGQEHLMNIQQQNQMGLNQQGHQLQMDMWNKTNYPAQIEMMRKAGLNPALMYGQAGASGQTGSQGGGSAAGGAVPAVNMNDMLIGSQIAKLRAEKDNIDADTKKKGGELANLKANTEKALYEAFESQMRGKLDRETFDDQVRIIRQKYIKDVIETEMLKSKTELNEQQKSQLEHKIYQEWAKVGFEGLDTVLSFLPKHMTKIVTDGVTTIKKSLSGG